MSNEREIWRRVSRVEVSNGTITRHLSCEHKLEISPISNFRQAADTARRQQGMPVRCAECEKQQEGQGQR